jgi:hypothetical protein
MDDMAQPKKMTLEKLAELMADGFEEVNGKIDTLTGDVEVMKDDVRDLKHDMREVKRDIAEIKTDLRAHGKVIDKDAVTLIDHKSRISKLEHAG